MNLKPDDIKISQKESLMWGTKQQEAIEYGNVIHEILSFVKAQGDIDFALSKAIENGLISISQRDIVYQRIWEIVFHAELGNYFSDDDQVLNEQTIISNQKNLIKPDRMALNKNNEVFLLDYKTGVHQNKYKLQLENYQSAIESMGFKVVKKALVYIGEKLEVVHL
jgi:ATP-dependent exoDNAse (exonuclease V) beta subunit